MDDIGKRMNDTIFKINDNINFYQYNEKFYIILKSDYFGNLRLGDFVMISNLLFIIKKHLINKYDFLNKDNLFFIIDKKNNIYIKDFNKFIKRYSKLYSQEIKIDNINKIQYDFSQILPKGNIWMYKCYIESCHYKLNDNDNYYNDIYGDVNKDTIYILPILKKNYNIERNWSEDFIISIIKKLDKNEKIKVISIDNYKLNNKIINKIRNINSNIIILNKVSWNDIINDIMLTCKEFISGDCGLSHFVTSLPKPYTPDIIKFYYNTKDVAEQVEGFKKYLIYPDKISKKVNFIPYNLYNKNFQIINK